MRELTQQEKDMLTRNIKLIEDDLEYKQMQIKEKQMLIECAPIKYKRQLEQMNSELKLYKSEAEENQAAIIELNRQLVEGVEEKCQ